MNCPKCENQQMDTFEIEGVEFDFCCKEGGCLGLWCEEGEMGQYLDSIKDLPFKQSLDDAKLSEFKCPQCEDEPLYHIQYARFDELELDICKACKGIFVDKGEFIKMEKMVAKLPLKDRLNSIKKQMKGYFS